MLATAKCCFSAIRFLQATPPPPLTASARRSKKASRNFPAPLKDNSRTPLLPSSPRTTDDEKDARRLRGALTNGRRCMLVIANLSALTRRCPGLPVECGHLPRCWPGCVLALLLKHQRNENRKLLPCDRSRVAAPGLYPGRLRTN